MQDWDDPTGAIDWPKLVDALAHAKRTGSLPEGHHSYDHLNEQVHIPLADGQLERWKVAFKRAEADFEARTGERVIWALLDGFLLYWDQVRIFSIFGG